MKDKKLKDSKTDDSNSMFVMGIMFIVFSLCFGWSKFFLFMGLIFLFNAVSKRQAIIDTCNQEKDFEIKD
ncbi:hypothetical protein [Psychroserpens luteolus]|uniref:hypothetical protein n=1 Tax=Psychroserpens luteolus TaxID=2855840 RepID=UPI001E4769C5|nr:hypothetical protein [Psychroserpens luteolus]MCD2260904.1 hypothetical protein [Psychroserpens luteolus]